MKHLLITALCISCALQATATMTCSRGERWNGSDPTLEVLGNYVVITTNGFNGTILFEGVTFDDRADFSRTRAFDQVYRNQIQTNEYISGKFCAYFDEERETIVVLDDGFTGAIAYSSRSVNKGSEAELWAVDVDLTSFDLEWGVEQSEGEILWLDENKNEIGITYIINDVKPVVFVTKVTSKTGGTQYTNRQSITPILGDDDITSIEKTDTEAVEKQVRKVFENGKIIIIKDGVKYNMQGVKVIEN
ncbi:MAG: hypothetical protein J6Y82_00440 [Bacteroidales bacterium]|nr:hypothetical protein [Bacteroidales bacterium]